MDDFHQGVRRLGPAALSHHDSAFPPCGRRGPTISAKRGPALTRWNPRGAREGPFDLFAAQSRHVDWK
ncbi:MAG TPA: hypothetical protein VK116_07835, partial [Planctomycetota bacterium]|nr:hypothetical protein [Planctomycetota bacterium]